MRNRHLYVSLHSFKGGQLAPAGGPTRPGVGQLAPVVVIPLFFNPDKTLGSRFPKLREYIAKTKNLLPIIMLRNSTFKHGVCRWYRKKGQLAQVSPTLSWYIDQRKGCLFMLGQ